MLTDRIRITHHAAEQYRKRIDQSVSMNDVVQLLTERAQYAAHLKDKTPLGDEQWRIDEPRACVLIVKRDKDRPIVAIVVTVLEPRPVFDEGDLLEYANEPPMPVGRRRKQRRSRHRHPRF